MNLALEVCAKLRMYYHFDKPWSECHVTISDQLSKLKKYMNKFNSTKNTVQNLIELRKFGKQDFDDILNIENKDRD